MKKLLMTVILGITCLFVATAEKSIGLGMTYGPDSARVNVLSGKPNTMSVEADFTYVWKKGILRYGWNAGAGYTHLWTPSDNTHREYDIDDVIAKNEKVRNEFDRVVSEAGMSNTFKKGSQIMDYYELTYKDFNGLDLKANALIGVEKGIFGADFLSGFAFGWGRINRDAGNTKESLDIIALNIELEEYNEEEIHLDYSGFEDLLSGACNVIQLSVPLEIKPFVRAGDHIKINASVKTDMFSLNIMSGSKSSTKSSWFKNWEFGAGVEFVL